VHGNVPDILVLNKPNFAESMLNRVCHSKSCDSLLKVVNILVRYLTTQNSEYKD
jgi:hypothetical protein